MTMPVQGFPRVIPLCLLLLGSNAVAAEDAPSPRRTPFTFVDSAPCISGTCVSKPLSTPAGSRAVIETFSFLMQMSPGKTADAISLRQESGGGTTFLHFAPVIGPTPYPGGVNYLASQQVRVYPDPRYPVVLLGSTTDQQFAIYIATISGYFEPIGAASLGP